MIVPQKVPGIDTSIEQDLEQVTLKMRGDLTIVEPIGTVTSVLAFIWPGVLTLFGSDCSVENT